MKTIEQEQAERTEVKWVLRKSLQPDPEQPRKEFGAEKLKELAESLKAMGQQIPLLVQALPGNGKGEARYQIIFGERRWRAAELAGIERLKVEVADTSAPDWTKRKLALQVAENQCRENLTALEEASALKRECETEKADEVAKRHGMSRCSLFGKLRLLELTEPVKKALLAGEVSVSVAGLVASVPAEKQAAALKEVSGDGDWSGPMPFRRAQERIESQFARQLGKASFDTTMAFSLEKGMVPSPNGSKLSTSCAACPKRSGNMEGSGLKNPNVCTQPVCFEAKTRAAGALKLEEAKKAGRVVIGGKEGAKIFSEYGDQDVNHSSGFVELDKRADLLGWEYKNHYRAALGDALKELPVTVAVDRNGVARELVKRADAEAALKESGKLKPAKPIASDREKQWKAEEEKRRKMKELAKQAHTELVLKASRPVKEMDAAFLQKLCLLAFVHADVEQLEKRPQLRESPESPGKTHRERFRNYVMKGIHPAEENLVGLLVDCLVTPEVTYDGNLAEQFQEALDLFGVKLGEKKSEKAPKEKTKAASRPTCRRTPKSKAKGKRGGKGK